MSEPTATQETNPGRAVGRTLLAALVAFFPLVNGVLLAVQDWLTQNTAIIPATLFTWANGILIAGLALAALVTRILAVPGVNDWLRKHLRILAPDDKTGAGTPAGTPAGTTPRDHGIQL